MDIHWAWPIVTGGAIGIVAGVAWDIYKERKRKRKCREEMDEIIRKGGRLAIVYPGSKEE